MTGLDPVRDEILEVAPIVFI
ncbi:hypothetical protein [Candidatus Nanosynbacter sp. BB002]